MHDENGLDYSHHRLGSDAMLTCTGVGADSDDEGYVFSWYSFDENGDRVPEVCQSTVHIRGKEGHRVIL